MRMLIPVAAAALGLAPLSVSAQAPKPQAPAKPQQQQAQKPPAPPPVAPARPYKPVAVKLPVPLGDESFDAFRKEFGAIVQRKDRAALARIVASNFFWEVEDGDKADKKKSGIDNLSAAVNLAAKDGSGWEALASFAFEPTAQPIPDRAGVICSPADPVFNDAELEEVAKATGTDPGEWGFPLSDGVEVHADAKPKSPVTEKLGMYFVRVLPDMIPPASASDIPMLKIVLPSGKTGFVSADTLAPLGADQMCFIKEGTAWKIAGFIGGD
ncbi:MAG: hypothetical protein HXY30_05270 [Pseudorhodoplanes sp.]|nr:hypothetical protein [Pseudorhodoplanes sp.]